MMKTVALASAIALVIGAYGQTSGNGAGKPGVDTEFDQYYNSQNETTISGTITGKVKGTPPEGQAAGVSVLVRSARGHVYSVDLGPAWYVASLAGRLNIGDHVTVTGSPIVVNNQEPIILARRIQKGHEIFAFRDGAGTPKWMANTPPGQSVTGTIVGQRPVTYQNQDEIAYELRTPSGLYDVMLAPNSWLTQNGYGFKFGQPVTFYFGPKPVLFGNNAYIANSFSTNGSTFNLNP